MNNKEKFLALVSKDKTNSLLRNKERIENRESIRESQQIAIKVLSKLDDLGWTQVKLAEELGVTPQQVTKIVSGKENSKIDTLKKIQRVLDIPIFASYYEESKMELKQKIGRVHLHPIFTISHDVIYQDGISAKTDSKVFGKEFYPRTIIGRA